MKTDQLGRNSAFYQPATEPMRISCTMSIKWISNYENFNESLSYIKFFLQKTFICFLVHNLQLFNAIRKLFDVNLCITAYDKLQQRVVYKCILTLHKIKPKYHESQLVDTRAQVYIKKTPCFKHCKSLTNRMYFIQKENVVALSIENIQTLFLA